MNGIAPPEKTDAASPCTNVCRMNPDMDLCEGCFRTLDEIATWSGLSDDNKRVVLAQLPARRTP